MPGPSALAITEFHCIVHTCTSVNFGILVSQEVHRVTSGQITHSQFFNTRSMLKDFNVLSATQGHHRTIKLGVCHKQNAHFKTIDQRFLKSNRSTNSVHTHMYTKETYIIHKPFFLNGQM